MRSKCSVCDEDLDQRGYYDVSSMTDEGASTVFLCSDECMAIFGMDVYCEVLDRKYGPGSEEVIADALEEWVDGLES